MSEINYEDLNSVLNALTEVQGAEKDMRQASRDATHFITKRDGQWDPYVWERMNGRFRGTFDMCTPIIDTIDGEISQADFTLRVAPAGGESSEDTAKVYDGLIRNIRNISNAEYSFQKASRANSICGFDAFEVIQDWVDADAFDQDLFIKRIPNAIDNVWFDGGSVEQSGDDAKWAVVLTAMTVNDYEKKFPKGSKASVGDDRRTNAYCQKNAKINIGRLVYKKPVTIDLVLMSDGSIYEADDEKYLKIKDDLEAQGITVQKERSRKSYRVYSRLFDGDVWLSEPEKTVFDKLPIVPLYGNFDMVENKRVYFGEIEKLYDQQRSLNYAISRDIEDGALAPSPTVWMTEKMGEGHDYSRMNIDRKGVRFFNTDTQNPGLTPQYTGGPQTSPGLQTTIMNMKEMIANSSNFFGAQLGNAAGMQSGIAGAQQIEQGNLSSTKWFKSLELAICQIGKVTIGALPKVYDSTQQRRILNEDGTTKMVPLNDIIIDGASGEIVEVNDLSKGYYDIVCETGPAFNNQQKETVQAFVDMAAIDPSIIERGKDIWLKNQKTPGMDQMAERAREDLINANRIPESQLTDEEKQKIQAAQQAAANQPPQEDPMMVAARAEEMKAQAETISAQTKQFEAQSAQQIKSQELQLEQQKIQLDVAKFQREKDDKYNVDAAKIDQGQQKIDQDQQKINLQAQNQQMQMMMDSQKQIVDALNTQANTLKTLREAMGVDATVGPDNTEAYKEQSEIVQDAQDEVS